MKTQVGPGLIIGTPRATRARKQGGAPQSLRGRMGPADPTSFWPPDHERELRSCCPVCVPLGNFMFFKQVPDHRDRAIATHLRGLDLTLGCGSPPTKTPLARHSRNAGTRPQVALLSAFSYGAPHTAVPAQHIMST